MAEDDKPKNPVTPKSAWVSTGYKRSAWVREKHGETIEEPNSQASNNDFRDDEVLQPRDQPIGVSVAFPLQGGEDRPTGGIAPTSGIN